MNREERTEREKKARARWGEIKTVEYPPAGSLEKAPKKNSGLPPEGKIELKAGYCPCGECGHEYMWECEDAACLCCSSTCD